MKHAAISSFTLFWALLLVLALGLPGSLAPCTHAEDEGEQGAEEEGEKGGEEEKGAEAEEDDELEEPSAEEARKLSTALKKVAKKKKTKEIMPALDAIEDYKHESFEKPLLKMLSHQNGEVAMRVAEMLCPRAHDKLMKGIWKAYMAKPNKKRYGVKGKILLIYADKEIKLDAKQFKEVESDWRWMNGNPQKEFGEHLLDYCAYIEATADPRLFRRMAEELSEPGTDIAVNSPSNPPAEWWERKWNMWKLMKPGLVSALKAITEHEFDTTAEAKAWFEANEKTAKKAGIDW